MSPGSDSRPAEVSCWTRFSPSPSMSMAPRDAKCPMRPSRWAGQSTLTQNVSDSPSMRMSGPWHTGHSAGKVHSGRPSGRFDRTGATTSGITSPALRTVTVSPGRTSFTRTWSWLWRVASCTVDPLTFTGSNWANGVAFPVRPMDTMMSLRRVVASSGGNL